MGSRGTESGKSIRNNGIVDIRIPLRCCLDLHEAIGRTPTGALLRMAWLRRDCSDCAFNSMSPRPLGPRPWVPGPLGLGSSRVLCGR